MFISFRGQRTKFALSLVVAMLSALTWFASVPVVAQSAPPSSQEPPKPAAGDQKKNPSQEKPDSQQPEKKPEEKKKEGAPAPFEPIPTAKPEQPPKPAPAPAAGPTAPETGRPAVNPVIEDIIITGNRRVPKETLRARILTRKGDPFDADALRRDYMALWNTNLLDDIKLTTEGGTKGIIATFTVKERPLVRKIEYEGNKSITRSEILDRFKERKVGLSQESQYDPTKIKRAEQVLKDYLAERGRQFAKVTHEVKEVPPSSVELTFIIEEGPKVKVGKIEFDGNTVFSDGTLVRAMKNERPKGIPPFFYLFHATFTGGNQFSDPGDGCGGPFPPPRGQMEHG